MSVHLNSHEDTLGTSGGRGSLGLSNILSSGSNKLIGDILANPKLTPATMAKWLDPLWIPAPHLMYVSLRIAIGISKGNGRIIVSLPPRHGKSRISSVGTSTWALDKWPEKQIIITSYGADLSEEFSGAVRDQIATNPHKLSVRLRKDSNRVDRFRTTHNGGMLAVGTGGGITGKGADILFVDDYIKDHEAARSHIQREFTWNWFTSTAFTRLEPNGSIIIVATRWDEDDLVGRLLEHEGTVENGGKWEYIRIPAIAEPNDILGRPVGTALFPERYNLEALLQWREILGTKVFDALYQQDPRSNESRLADRAWIQLCTELPNPNLLAWCRVWDLAATQGGGDYTTGGLHALDVETRMVFHAQMIRKQLSPKNVEKLVRETAELDGPSVPIYIEQEPGSSGVALVSHYANNVLKGYKVKGVPTTKAKAIRAQPYLAGAEFGRVWILKGPWNETFLKEFDHFPTGEYDDQVDNGAIAWEVLVGKESPGVAWGRKSKTKPFTGQATSESDQQAIEKEAMEIALLQRSKLVMSSIRTNNDPFGRRSTRNPQASQPVTGASWGRSSRVPQSSRAPKLDGVVFRSSR